MWRAAARGVSRALSAGPRRGEPAAHLRAGALVRGCRRRRRRPRAVHVARRARRPLGPRHGADGGAREGRRRRRGGGHRDFDLPARHQGDRQPA